MFEARSMMFHRSDKYSFSPDEYSEYTSDHMLPLRKKKLLFAAICGRMVVVLLLANLRYHIQPNIWMPIYSLSIIRWAAWS